MVDDWIELPFSEAVLLNPSTPLKRGAIYPFVDMAAVMAGARDVTCSEQREFNGGGSRFQDRDTLMARITPCLENGKLARFRAPIDQRVGHGSTEFIVVRGKPEVTDNDFAYYLTISPEIRSFAISQMTGSSGRQRVPTDSLGGISVLIPSLKEQRKIVTVLSDLDDKIAVNERMNTTLEAMAHALFQSWFVDFDPVRAKLDGSKPAGIDEPTANLFPDTFQDSELGNIPKGWTIKPVGEVVDCVGGGTPSTAELKYWEGGTHHWTTPKDFSSLQSPILLNTDRKLTDAGIAKISSGLLPAGTLLLSSRAPVGYLAIASMPVAINQGFIALKCNEYASNYFMLNWCQSNMPEIESRATGTTFAEISKQNFRPIRVVLPSKDLMSAFTAKVEPLYEQITANLRQSQTLASLRDTLLPKLLSGELSVENLQP
jgi:type I restriction enzyme S subunit